MLLKKQRRQETTLLPNILTKIGKNIVCITDYNFLGVLGEVMETPNKLFFVPMQSLLTKSLFNMTLQNLMPEKLL